VSNWWDEHAEQVENGAEPLGSGTQAPSYHEVYPDPVPMPWWQPLAPLLAVLGFGYIAIRSGRRKLGYTQLALYLALGIAALIVWYNDFWVEIVVTEWYLIGTLAAIFIVCAVALAAAVVAWRDCEHWTPSAAQVWSARLMTVMAVAAVGAPAAAATYVIGPQIQVARNSFVDAPVAMPSELDSTTPTSEVGTTTTLAVPGQPTTPLETVLSATTDVPDTSAPTTEAPAGESRRVNILLLGGDAGPGRWNLRTDSMNLVSIDIKTGDSAIIGIPRNLKNAPMPRGELRKQFPNGFDDLMNAMFVWGDRNAKKVRAALGDTDVPGASLVSASAAELLGVRIDAWILVDMAGFIDVIDALGGLDVYVPKKVPAPGNVPAGKHRLQKYYTKGWHRMDGTDALGFARSRTADSDYFRMARQRCLLASIAAQKGAGELATHWPALSKVIAKRLRTNLTSSLLKDLLKLAGVGVQAARSVALTPPLVPGVGWNAKLVREVVADAIDNEGKYAPAPTDSVTGTTKPIGQAPNSGVSTIGESCRTKP
jgi:LCP family protein required for cell wall assembly